MMMKIIIRTLPIIRIVLLILSHYCKLDDGQVLCLNSKNHGERTTAVQNMTARRLLVVVLRAGISKWRILLIQAVSWRIQPALHIVWIAEKAKLRDITDKHLLTALLSKTETTELQSTLCSGRTCIRAKANCRCGIQCSLICWPELRGTLNWFAAEIVMVWISWDTQRSRKWTFGFAQRYLRLPALLA